LNPKNILRGEFTRSRKRRMRREACILAYDAATYGPI
jgi:hypothetical protein